MHHVRIALDRHLLGDADAANLRDAADIVASQVEQHDVLGDFLRIVHELGRQRLVGVARRAARPCAGEHRPVRDRR